MRAFVAWRVGILFDRRKDDSVVCVFFMFNVGGSVCGCMCVYTHTHTHTTQMEYADVSPGVGMRHLEGPKNPNGLNLRIYIDLTCKRGSVGQIEGKLIPMSSVWFRPNLDDSNSHGFELHRPSIKGTKILLKVIKAIIIIITITRICVQSTHVYVYAKRQDEILD